MRRHLIVMLAVPALGLAVTGMSAAAARPGGVTAHRSGAIASPAAITKLLVIVEENHSAAAITPATAPYITSLSARYAHASNYRSVGFPSLPNYMAIAGGSTFGITQDGSPARFGVNAPSVFGQALKAGHTARVYSESATTACDTLGTALYVVRHNPWPYFRPEAAACHTYDVGFASLTAGTLATDVANGTLPNVGLVVPNLTDDGHTPGGNAGLANSDRWLSKAIPFLQSGPDWRNGHLAIVITWDSGSGPSMPAVDLIVVAPTLSHVTVTTPLNHYSLSRLLSDFGGSAPLAQAKRATDMRNLFHLG